MNDDPTAIEHLRATLKQSLAQGNRVAALTSLEGLSAADIADLIEGSALGDRLALWPLLSPALKGEVLVEAQREVREQLIGATPSDELVAALSRVDIDALADIDHALPAAVVDALVQAMDMQRRQRFEAVRSWPDDTAGGLMDVDALAVRADVTLEVVLRYLRTMRQEHGALPAHTDAVMVTSHDNRYLGVLKLSELISRDPAQTVASVMEHEVAAIPVTLTAANVAQRFQNRDLVSAAVVDDDGRLLGRITVDDVLDVIRTQQDEAALSPAGLPAGVDLFAPVWTSTRQRAGWLGVHLTVAFAGVWVIGQFEASIAKLVALAMLMPVIAAAGGVAGNQTQALVTRGLALAQVGRANAARLLRKELGVSLATGALWALTIGLVVGLWFDNGLLALVFGIALVANLLAAALAGTLVPIALDRFGFDPALGSTVFVTAFADIMGFFCFLGLATLWVV
jgi:magnesium transporter